MNEAKKSFRYDQKKSTFVHAILIIPIRSIYLNWANGDGEVRGVSSGHNFALRARDFLQMFFVVILVVLLLLKLFIKF